MNRHSCIVILALMALSPPAHAQRQMENLKRGAVAIRQSADQVFLSWRLMGTDPVDISFDVYRATQGQVFEKINKEPIVESTNFTDSSAPLDDQLRYSVLAVLNGEELSAHKPISVWERGFLEIPIKSISGYRPGDTSVGDLDGDGQLDIVLTKSRERATMGLLGSPANQF